ncbi:MAG: hypothetical protein WCY77_10010 [Weeksellaceae bacterium]
MIYNFPTDIEKKIDNIIISLPFSDLSVKNQLKNIIPSESDLILKGKALKVRILPSDASLSNKLNKSKSGSYWSFSSNFEIVDNNKTNFTRLNFFTNEKVVIVIGTSTYRYQLGNKNQPLEFSFIENETGFKVTVSGNCYYPASRQIISSFRTTS